MSYLIPSLLIDSSVNVVLWMVKKSTYGIYCGLYQVVFGKEETIEDKMNRLLEKEKRQDKLLIEAIDKLNIQEIELSRLNKKYNSEETKDKESLDDYVVIL